MKQDTRTIPTVPYRKPLASLRIFCFPFAGAGASQYRIWGRMLPDFVEVCPVQLPGREERFDKPAFTALPELIESLTADLKSFLNKPFVLFGHSMGALISFELTRALRRAGLPAPLMLILSAFPAPHLIRRLLYNLSDEDFIEALKEFAGAPAELFQNQEMMDFVMPALRADFMMCDTYTFQPEPPLDIPFVVYGGIDDALTSREELAAWRQHTTSSFSLEMIPGNHLFIQTQRDQLLRSIGAVLQQFKQRS